MKSVGEIASEIWTVLYFLPFFGKIWPWPLTLTKGQSHRPLGHWLCLFGLYLGTKYDVCRWNSLWDMTSSSVFYPFLGKIWPWPLTLTLSQGHRHYGHWMRIIGLYLDTKYEVCRWNSLRDRTSSLVFLPIFGEIWPWPLTLTLGQGHRQLGHSMCLIGLYLCPKYEVFTSRWNSLHDMISSLVFYPFFGKFDLDLWVKVIGTWVIECASLGCTFVPSMKCLLVGEIVSKIWQVLWFFTHFWENLTLTLGQGHRHYFPWMRLLGCTLVPSMKSVGEIASEIWPVLYFFIIFGEIWPWSETLTLG